MEPPKPNSLKKQMGPKKKCLYHQRILVIEHDTPLRGPENIPTISNP